MGMVLYRLKTYKKFIGDLLVGLSFANSVHNFPFPFRNPIRFTEQRLFFGIGAPGIYGDKSNIGFEL